jgi:hypothetical protein
VCCPCRGLTSHKPPQRVFWSRGCGWSRTWFPLCQRNNWFDESCG